MKDLRFFSILIIVLIVIVLFSAFVNVLFKVEPELESFDFSKQGILIFDDAFRGTNPDSNFVFAFFIDFKCPACVQQYPIIKELILNHPEVNFLFKHLTDSSDQNSDFGARAFECAKLQGKGYELADYMFTNQFTQAKIFDYASALGINTPKFVECLNQTEISILVNTDRLHATSLDVRGSPTIFLDGIKIEGAHSYEVYDELIKKELKNEK